jgi:tetratricopeptide (TPR) repeat protein
MQDPTLSIMLHRNDIKAKSKDSSSNSINQTSAFNKALEKNIKEYTDALIKELDPDNFKFLSQSSLQEKIEKEVGETLNFAETGDLIVCAIKIIINEGHSYLSNENYETLISEIEKIKSKIDALDFDQLNNESFKSAFSIPENCRDHILNIGISKYNAGLLPDSLALFTFLSNLDKGDADYAYRLGIIAQKNGRFDLAIEAFTIASDLNPQLLGSRLFTAECLLASNQIEKAAQLLAEVKEITKNHADTEWQALIAEIESKIIEIKH